MAQPDAYPPTADELTEAYRRARLRWAGISYQKALTDPLILRSLDGQVMAMRKEQQHGQPAPIQRAA